MSPSEDKQNFSFCETVSASTQSLGLGNQPRLSEWVHRQGPGSGVDRRGRAKLCLCFPCSWGWSFLMREGLSTCIYDSRSQMRSRTKLHSMNRKSPKHACKGNLEAEAIRRAEAGDLSPRGFLPEEKRERSEVPETLQIRMESAVRTQPPGGAAGPKVPGAHRCQER